MALFAGLAAMIVMIFVFLGCSNIAPSTADVTKAFMAMTIAQSSAPAANSVPYTKAGGVYTYSPGPLSNPNGGSVTVVYTSNTNPGGGGPSTIAGTLTFSNWVDLSTGYTINGTVSLSETISDPSAYPITITGTINGSFSLTGGPVSTLTCRIYESVSIPATLIPTITLAGTVTANGYPYDVTKL